MSKRRRETWLAIIVLGIALIPAAILGLWVFMGATATPLHPNPQEVPSTIRGSSLPKWAVAVGQSRQIVRAALSEQNVPGMSVAIGIAGGIVWAEGFGWADLEKRLPVTPETRFRIGTASTTLTAAAVGTLLEKDRLNLDEEIQNYVPEFPKKPWPVTLRQLMGHISGVRNDGGDEGALLSVSCDRPVDGVHHFAEQSLLFEPGTQYRYSSYGWIIVSSAIEAAAHEPFFMFMRRQIFEPLGMQDTLAEFATESIPNRATFYFPRFAADPRYGLHLMRPIDYSCYAGSSAFLSTPSDMVRFGMAINGGKLLQNATVQLLQTSQRLMSGEQTRYGLGFDLEDVALANHQTRWVGHDGTALGGTVTSLMTFPDHGVVVSVTSNMPYADTSSVALKIAEVFTESTKTTIGAHSSEPQ